MMTRAILTALCLALPLPAAADEDLARLAEGALPIDQALDLVAARYRGRMIAAELDEDDGRTVYDFRWLTPEANVLRIRLDAVTGRFLLVEGVGQTEARILP